MIILTHQATTYTQFNADIFLADLSIHNAVQFVVRAADKPGGVLLSNTVTDGANNSTDDGQPKAYL